MKLCALWFLHFVANISARIWRENMDRSVTRFVRTTKFEPEVRYKVCLLRPQEGPCRSKITMYYFKKSTMSCVRFDWGGCQGNGNRFDTEDECLNYCLTKAGHTSPRPFWCQLTFEYGTCFGEVEKYYYDAKWMVCKKAMYSGCGGNDNKFNTYAECEAMCLLGLGDTTVIGQGSTNYGYSRVLVVDPIVTPPRRGHDLLSTTKSGNGKDGEPGRGRDGAASGRGRDGAPARGRDGESARGRDGDPARGRDGSDADR